MRYQMNLLLANRFTNIFRWRHIFVSARMIRRILRNRDRYKRKQPRFLETQQIYIKMKRRQGTQLAIFLMFIFCCEGKSLNTEPSTLIINNSENSNNNNNDTNANDDVYANLVSGNNNEENSNSDNVNGESAAYPLIINNSENNNDDNNASNDNDEVNNSNVNNDDPVVLSPTINNLNNNNNVFIFDEDAVNENDNGNNNYFSNSQQIISDRDLRSILKYIESLMRSILSIIVNVNVSVGNYP